MKKFIIPIFVFLATILCCAGWACGDTGSTSDNSQQSESTDTHVHEFVVYESQEASCEADGYQKLQCACGEMSEESIPMLGHDIQAFTTPATCTEPGVIQHKCTRCDTKESEETIPALGHDIQAFTTPATCTDPGVTQHKCTRCDTKESEETIPALGHNVQQFATASPTCTKSGVKKYKCTRCGGEASEEVLPALGHEMSEYVEASRITYCTRKSCGYVEAPQGNGKYSEVLTFTFGDSDKALLEAKHNELADILAAAEPYNPELHALATEGALYEAYKNAEALYEEYTNLIYEAQGQYSIAMTLYYCDHKNEELEQRYNDMQTYYTDLVADYFSLSQPWYDSMFREFFFEGSTEEEINAFLFDSNAYANEEYTSLKNRNDEIELEFNGITDPTSGSQVPTLYAEFAANNMRIAELLGYENYLEYAYENVYDRDYSYQDAAKFVEYVIEYLVPVYNAVYDSWNELTNGNLSFTDLNTYYKVVNNSFFKDTFSNKLLNDYIDDMNMAFTSNPDKQISFSDVLNDLMSDGNMFRGTYEGAYVTYIRGVNVPIAYFGKNYDSAVTVAHEFGHYMNEIYNEDAYNQSFDLLETHSTGQEMLFLTYAKDYLSGNALKLVETYTLLSNLQSIILATQVDCFEQAIYLNHYEGPDAEKIMADGQITADEYDEVYAGLSTYFGIKNTYRVDEYWRYVTISSPCYYISYAISGVNALQIYATANEEGFDVAKEAYLKLFTYTDENPEMTTEEVLLYAGLTSYIDEQTFTLISSLLG